MILGFQHLQNRRKRSFGYPPMSNILFFPKYANFWAISRNSIEAQKTFGTWKKSPSSSLGGGGGIQLSVSAKHSQKCQFLANCQQKMAGSVDQSPNTVFFALMWFLACAFVHTAHFLATPACVATHFKQHDKTSWRGQTTMRGRFCY